MNAMSDRDPIDLSLGQLVLGDAPVPFSGNAYGLPGGEIAARQAFANWLGAEVDRVAVVAGASMGIASALATLPRCGRVLCPRPFYPIYPRLGALLGITLEYYDLSPEDDWQPSIQALRATMSNDVAAILVNWPGNPTGALPTEATLLGLGQLVREHELEVIADEAYADFVFGDSPLRRLENYIPVERLVRVRSGSKLLRLAGERIGYVIASPERLLRLCHAHWTLALSPPAHAQKEATLRLLGDIETESEQLRNTLCASRNAMHDVLSSSPLVDVDLPGGGIFIWVRSRYDLDIDRLVSLCAEDGVLVVPGRVFGVSEPACLRLSFGVREDDARVGAERTLKAIARATEQHRAPNLMTAR